MSAVCAGRLGFGRWAVSAALVCCFATAAPASAASAVPAKTARYAKVSRVCPPLRPGSATCFALARTPVPVSAAHQPGVRPYTIGGGAAESGPAGGYTPAELASAYGYDPAAGGSGQTIAIVDAYDDPSIEADLRKFDEHYEIAACTEANGCLTKVSQTGSTSSLPAADTSGWSVEISLDVEVAHSTCPQCKILLVEAKNATFHNLAIAVNEAVGLGADEVSNSYGGPEEALGAFEEEAYDHPGTVIAASTGDDGWDNWTVANEGYRPPARPNIPASMSSVVAVGGTTLRLDSAGGRQSETVWNGNGLEDSGEYIEGATGGGCSLLFSAQPWQRHAPGFAASGCGARRLAADVAAVADPYTGFDIYDSYNCGEACEYFKGGGDWVTIGGTSLSAPRVSALYALAGGGHGIEYPALTLYGHLGDSSLLYDVTEGGNGFCDDQGYACGANAFFELALDCEGTTACNATSGFDGPTGVGAPKGLGLFEPAAPVAAIAPPGSLVSGQAASFSGAGSSDPYPGAVVSYHWNWGDGSPEGGGVAPAHTYAASGEYTVTLTVTDGYGLSSAPASRTVLVMTAEEAAGKAEEEAARKRAEEEARRAEEEAARRKTEEEAAHRAGEIALEQQHLSEEAARRKAEEEALAHVATGVQGVSGFQSGLVPPVPDARLAGATLRVRRNGTVTLRIGCPADVSACTGRVVLRTLGAVRAGARGKKAGRRTALTLATASFAVAGEHVRGVTLSLSRRARALIARRRTLRVRVILRAHDPQGTAHTTHAIATLRAARPRHRGHRG